MIPLLLAAVLTVDLQAIKQIESGGNPAAYNRTSQARGLYQITPICLADYNQYHKHNQHRDIREEDLFDPVVNEKIAAWYLYHRIPALLDHYGLQITTDNILWAYNAGIGKVKDRILPPETREYIQKYKKLTGR